MIILKCVFTQVDYILASTYSGVEVQVGWGVGVLPGASKKHSVSVSRASSARAVLPSKSPSHATQNHAGTSPSGCQKYESTRNDSATSIAGDSSLNLCYGGTSPIFPHAVYLSKRTVRMEWTRV